jgi:hypothetical protein
MVGIAHVLLISRKNNCEGDVICPSDVTVLLEYVTQRHLWPRQCFHVFRYVTVAVKNERFAIMHNLVYNQ